ncbi:uncharacterized protein [Rutidosis leptorrhynchoides]|uniref:uncharacterized protein n=1 Tax=Rutidosis leptorrhynchoides TaxID=125765 RepID=UPI003A9A5E7D
MPDDIMKFMTNGWLDISIITWFSMTCFTYQKRLTTPKRCVFLNPNRISQGICSEGPEEVTAYIKKIMTQDRDKYYILPYHQLNHWSLFIIYPSKKYGYILDSLKGTKVAQDYLLSGLVDEAIGRCLWDLPPCQQQRSGWECGYYVMKWIHRFILYEQH